MWLLEYTYNHRPVLVLHQLSNGYTEAQLDAFAQAVNSRSDDQCVEILCAGTDDQSDQAYAIASNEKPTAAEQIAQAS